MPANFSVAYDCYSLKTISDFYNKAYKIAWTNKLYAFQKAPAGDC